MLTYVNIQILNHFFMNGNVYTKLSLNEKSTHPTMWAVP